MPRSTRRAQRDQATTSGGAWTSALPDRDRPRLEVLPGRLADVLPLEGVDAVAVPVAPPSAGEDVVEPRPGAADAAVLYGIDLAAVCERLEVRGKAGQVVTVPLVDVPSGLPGRLLLVGVGDGDATDLRRAGAALARAVRGRERLVTTLAAEASAEGTRAFVEGLLLGGYSPPRSGVTDGPKPGPRQVDLVGRHDEGIVRRAQTCGGATLLVRDLANTHSGVKDPAWVADRAREVAAREDLDIEVWDDQRLRQDGFGGLLAVGAGSASTPRLVRVSYQPEGSGSLEGNGSRDGAPSPKSVSRHVVLVGKGITFDTGGLSIKPREAMVPMKTDMAGAAVVLAALSACRALGVRARVTGLLALAENAVSGSAYRPGDVITQYGGRTVEIANTDAEGRLVLADALAYADAHLDPDVLIDIATLTGAASLGLGRRHAALYSADDRLVTSLETAAKRSGERVWRMPLVQDYRASLDSDVADIRHVPSDKKVGGGSITAALFLREFVGSRRWAHLDIAGPARADSDEHEITKGATGYGARLLLRWLEALR